MIVKKVTLIKIFWTQKIKILKKICMKSDKVCHDMQKITENPSFYSSFVRYFWNRDYFWIHMSSNYRSKARNELKSINFLWIFTCHGTLSHFPYKFFPNFLLFGSRKFWSKLPFLRSWNPLAFYSLLLLLSWIINFFMFYQIFNQFKIINRQKVDKNASY